MPKSIKCTDCGAPLRIEDDRQRRVTCPYCGALSDVSAHVEPLPVRVVEVERRVVEVERVPAPAPASARRLPVAREPPSCLGFIVWGGPIPALMGVIALFSAWMSAGIGQWPWEDMFWASPSALLVNLDGDPELEVVGHVRFLSDADGCTGWARSPGETTWTGGVAAFDPVDEDRLWYTEIEGLDTYPLTLAVAGDRLWVADDAGTFRMLRLADGHIDTTSSLGEKLDAFCSTGDGGFAARLANHTERRVDLATGALAAPTEVRDQAPCGGGFAGSAPGETVDTRLLGPHGDAGYAEDDARWHEAGLSAWATLLGAGGEAFVLAARATGTAVPTVVALGPDGAERWRKEIPSVDVLKAAEGPPEAAALHGGNLYVGWSLRDGEEPHRVACFDANTGERHWDATLPEDDEAEEIAADDRFVYVQAFTRLIALDAETGAYRFTIGR